MNRQDIDAKCDQIIDWFIRKHNKWVQENKLVSWAEKLGIKLNYNGMLDERQLFHLFVLAVLWNSRPTYRVEKGEKVFLDIKDEYALSNFKNALKDNNTRELLKEIAYIKIGNSSVFNILSFIVNGEINGKPVWSRIKEILDLGKVGDKNSDVSRLKWLYHIFNPTNGRRYYEGKAYLTKKIFLIFREIRIQFRASGKYQYHPAICCVPDRHVQQALIKLGILDSERNGVNGFLEVSKIIAEYFCRPPYELYDLPLFLANREEHSPLNKNVSSSLKQSLENEDLDICPKRG